MEERVEIVVPEGIAVKIDNNKVVLSKDNNELEEKFVVPKLKIVSGQGKILVTLDYKNKRERAVLNTIKSKIQNMIKGLLDGYTAECEVIYSHFPMTVTKKDDFVEIVNFLGGKKILRSKIVGKTNVKIDGKRILVSGISKEDVGQTAANMEKTTRVRFKDRRVYSDGIYIVKKAS